MLSWGVPYVLVAVLGLGPLLLVLLVRRSGRLGWWRIALAFLLLVAIGAGEWLVHDLRSSPLPDWSNTNFNGLFIVH